MENIFEGAKFGDMFITRGQEKCLLLEIKKDYVTVWREEFGEPERYNYDGTLCLISHLSDYNKEFLSNYDIIDKWKEPTDEEKLDTLADDFCGKFDFEPTQRNPTDSGWEYGHTYTQLVECYKAGYHKAKEE